MVSSGELAGARWAAAAATVAAGLAIPFSSIHPVTFQAAVNVAAAAVLVVLSRRIGLAAALIAAVSGYLLQGAPRALMGQPTTAMTGLRLAIAE